MAGRRWRRRDRPSPFERGWFRRANAAPRPGRCPSLPGERRARCRDRGVSRRGSREPPAAARSGLRRLHGRPSRWRPASEKTTLPRLRTWDTGSRVGNPKASPALPAAVGRGDRRKAAFLAVSVGRACGAPFAGRHGPRAVHLRAEPARRRKRTRDLLIPNRPCSPSAPASSPCFLLNH